MKNVQSYVEKTPTNYLKIFESHGNIPKLNKSMASDKDVGHEKKFKINKHRA
jgi:hypothetical protein